MPAEIFASVAKGEYGQPSGYTYPKALGGTQVEKGLWPPTNVTQLATVWTNAGSSFWCGGSASLLGLVSQVDAMKSGSVVE